MLTEAVFKILIDLTCFVPWASETRGIGSADFGFDSGGRAWEFGSSPA